MTVVASLVLAGAGLGSLYLAHRKLKQDDKQHQELVSSLNKIMQSYDNELKELRGKVDALRLEAGRGSRAEEAKIDLEKQKLEEAKRQNEWARFLDFARGVKWYLEQGEEE